MWWLRSRVRFGPWTALFALAIQLALSFGHVHAKGTSQLASWPLALRWVMQQPEQPADNPATLAGDNCAICLVMQLTGLAAEPPTLAMPVTVHWLTLRAPIEFASTANPHKAFHARAPPGV